MKALTPDQAERQQFYDLLWGDTPGFVLVVAGVNGEELAACGWLRDKESASADYIGMLEWTRETFDADKASGRPHTRKIFEWPKQVRALDAYAARCIEQYGNVFVRQTVFLRRGAPGTIEKNKLSNPAPSRVFVVDDAPENPDLPYSFVVETSPYSRHAYYQVDAPQPAGRLATLAGGAAERLGADKSGSDREQLVRVPTSRNTKAKADYHRVTFQPGAGSYPAETIARAFLVNDASEPRTRAATGQRTRAGDIGSGDEPWRQQSWRDALERQAEQWLPLVRTGRGGMLADNGMPRGLQPHQPGYKILEARQRGEITYVSPSGNWDASRERENAMRSLMYIGYDDAQIAAMALSLLDFGIGVKGSDAIWIDICRLICRQAAQLGDKRRIRNARPQANAGEAPRPHIPRARKDRPQRIDAPGLHKLYDANRDVVSLLDRKGRAALAHGISLPTLDRLERTLRTGDNPAIAIENERTPRGWTSRVRVLWGADDDNTPVIRLTANTRIATPNLEKACDMGDHTPQDQAPQTAPEPQPAPPAKLPTLAELVAQAREQRVLNPATGEMQAPNLRQARRIVAQTAEAAGVTVDPVFVKAEFERLRDADEWAARRITVRSLSDADLLARCKADARVHTRAVRRGNPNAKYFAVCAEISDQERRRRGLQLVDTPRKPKRQVDWQARKAAAADTSARRAATARRLPQAEESATSLPIWHGDEPEETPPAPEPLPIPWRYVVTTYQDLGAEAVRWWCSTCRPDLDVDDILARLRRVEARHAGQPAPEANSAVCPPQPAGLAAPTGTVPHLLASLRAMKTAPATAPA